MLLAVGLIGRALCARVEVRPGSATARGVARTCGQLTAEGITTASEATELAVMGAALQKDIVSRFSQSNRNAHALFLAEDPAATNAEGVVGCIGIAVERLSPQAQNANRLGKFDARLADRPLLSSLAVAPAYRKKGIAKRLCGAAERAAREWGYDEILLRVERDNGRARALYRKLGYRVVAVDKQAERPEASPAGGLKWVATTQVVMRKDLRAPPLDAVALPLLAAAALWYAWTSLEPADAAALLDAARSGRLDDAVAAVLDAAARLGA